MTWLRIVLAVLIVAAELVLWAGARSNGYGKTADGAFYAAVIGWAGVALVPDDDVAMWSVLLAVAATITQMAMAFNKGELR